MRISLYIPSFVFLVTASFGQTENKESSLEDVPILDEVFYKQGKDTLVIQRIEQPEFLGKATEKKDDQPITGKAEEHLKVTLPIQTYIVSATSFKNKATALKIWPSHRGAEGALEGWSNIDWSILQGVLSFDGDKSRYQFMLFHSGNGQGAEIPAELPDFDQTGARYLVTSSNEAEREDTLDFLESIHALYDENRQQLKSERNLAIKKQEERKRQIEKEAVKPKTRVLKIWRHTRSEDEQVSE